MAAICPTDSHLYARANARVRYRRTAWMCSNHRLAQRIAISVRGKTGRMNWIQHLRPGIPHITQRHRYRGCGR